MINLLLTTLLLFFWLVGVFGCVNPAEWHKTIDSRRETDVIYLDYKKAFDSVPHKRLIGILKQFAKKRKHTVLDQRVFFEQDDKEL